MPSLNARFTERYPEIEVKVQRLVNTEVQAKLEQEIRSGNVVADLVLSSTHDPARITNGWYAKYRPATISEETLHEVGFREHDYFNAAFATAYGIAYNTEKLSKDEVPTTYEELLDPEWKGRLVITDPKKSGGTSVMMSLLEHAEVTEPSWAEKMAAQEPGIISETPQVVQALVSGKGDVSWGLSMPFTLKGRDEGAPIDYLFPLDDGNSILTQSAYALLEDAPHPNAARLFYSWVFTPEGQEGFAEEYYYPLMAGAPGPEGYPSIDDVDVVPLPKDEDRAALLAAVMERNTKLF